MSQPTTTFSDPPADLLNFDDTVKIEQDVEDDNGDDDHQSASDPENDDFYFESDHLALRGNADYTAVLRTIAILQTQRIQVTKDIDRLAMAEQKAMDDPEEFVRQLGAGELQMPGAVSVADVRRQYIVIILFALIYNFCFSCQR